jgi:hypothetical protein
MEPSPSSRICPQCGQLLPPDAGACAKCGRDEANPFTPPAAPIERVPAAEGDPRLYGAILAVIAVSMVVSFIVPGVGIPLGILLVPAAVRAAAVLKKQEAAASATTRKIGFWHALLTSAGVTFLVWLASAIAFTIICFPLGLLSFDINTGGGVGLIVGAVLGFAAGLAVFIWLTRRFWPRAEKD